MNNQLNKLLLVGVVVELIIFITAYVMQPSIEETFRYSARYSGRVSFTVFLIAFYLFAFSQPKPISENGSLKNWLIVFTVLHIIHFGFLATTVVLNNIQLVPVKLVGGSLAYLMIVCAPFILHKLKLSLQLIYFYYVSIVMITTYIARAKGDFEGAEPFWFHYVALIIIAICCLLFGYKIYINNKKVLI